MFDFNNNNLEKEIRKDDARRKLVSEMMDFLSEIMLDSDAPESKKSQIRLVMASKNLNDLIHTTAVKYSTVDNPNVELSQKLCFLYATMTAQINALLENYPIEAGTESKDA